MEVTWIIEAFELLIGLARGEKKSCLIRWMNERMREKKPSLLSSSMTFHRITKMIVSLFQIHWIPTNRARPHSFTKYRCQWDERDTPKSHLILSQSISESIDFTRCLLIKTFRWYAIELKIVYITRNLSRLTPSPTIPHSKCYDTDTVLSMN